MSNHQVGVNLVEGTSVSPIEGVTTAVSALIGTFERGPLNVATLVTSMAQFQSIFGTVPAAGSTSWYSVEAYFAKTGSGSLYVVRVASSTAASASHTFKDRDSGTPADTLKIEGDNEGAWGNNLAVQIEDDSILTTTLAENADATDTSAVLTSIEGLEVGSDVSFYNGTNTEYVRVISIDHANNTIHWTGGLTNAYTTANGVITSQEFKLTVSVKAVEVEEWAGLSINPDVSFYVEKVVASSYILCTDVLAAPTNTHEDQPVAIAATALTSGADGLDDVEATDYSGSQVDKTGVYALDAIPDVFRLCCPNPLQTEASPEVSYQALVQALLDYVNTRVTMTYYADIPYAQTLAEAVTFAQNFAGRRLVFFWPWLKVIKNSLPVWLPPSSFVLGVAAEKDYRRGVHKNVGNETVPYAIDLEYNVSRAEGETLNNAGVNTIRKFVPGGIKTYGGRTMSTLTAWRFVHFSELWNYVGRSLEVATQDVVFEVHDEVLWKAVVRRVSAFLSNEQRKGAIGDFAVVMDATNNPPDQVALGIAQVDIEYVPAATAEKFVITLTSSPAGLSVSA